MVYLITYDLNKKGQNYDKLYEAIKSLGSWWHYLDSTWLVETSYSASQISEKLRKEGIDDNDNLLVFRLLKDYAGWLSKEAWQWIESANFN